MSFLGFFRKVDDLHAQGYLDAHVEERKVGEPVTSLKDDE